MINLQSTIFKFAAYIGRLASGRFKILLQLPEQVNLGGFVHTQVPRFTTHFQVVDARARSRARKPISPFNPNFSAKERKLTMEYTS